jgi:hypothetical protein
VGSRIEENPMRTPKGGGRREEVKLLLPLDLIELLRWIYNS